MTGLLVPLNHFSRHVVVVTSASHVARGVLVYLWRVQDQRFWGPFTAKPRDRTFCTPDPCYRYGAASSTRSDHQSWYGSITWLATANLNSSRTTTRNLATGLVGFLFYFDRGHAFRLWQCYLRLCFARWAWKGIGSVARVVG
jgi:hypothetical protein